MERNQKIFCDVESCKYNNIKNSHCTLSEIRVTPTENCSSKEYDESMCSNYEYNN